MPSRTGGLEYTAANLMPPGTASGSAGTTLLRPARSALRAQRSSARRLTSTAQTRASGLRSATVMAIAPYPQPTSISSPGGTGGQASEQEIGTEVEVTMREDASVGVELEAHGPGGVTRIVCGREATFGSAVK